MKREEKKILKRILKYIRMPRLINWLSYKKRMTNDKFRQRALEPLEKLVRWSKKDEALLKKRAKKLVERLNRLERYRKKIKMLLVIV